MEAENELLSYEGYSQLLCQKGHIWNVGCNEMPNLMYEEPRNMKCPFCKKKAIWENMVDETNGSWDEVDGHRIDGFVKLKVKSKTSGECSACGKEHICEITYEIPKEEGRLYAKGLNGGGK